VLAALGVGSILALSGDLTLYAVLPAYADRRTFDMAMVGVLLSANRLVRLGSNPLVGLLLAGAPRRRFVLAGFGLGALSTLLYVLAGGSGLFLAGRLLWGISWSLINIGGYCMLLDVTDESDRGWGSGVVQGFFFVGLALNPLLGGVLSDRLGFTQALAVCAALSAAGYVFALFSLPETLPDGQTGRLPLRGVLRGLLRAWDLQATAARSAFRPPALTAHYVYFAAHFVGDGILLSTLSLYIQTAFGSLYQVGGLALSVATAGGALLALRAGISALVAPLAGSLSDRSGSRWGWLGWGAGLGAAGLFLIAGSGAAWALPLGVALAAAGSAMIMTITPPLAREIQPEQPSGTVLGLLANAADLGMALAPLAAYLLLETLSLDAIYSLTGAGLLAGLPLAWAAARTAPTAS
jgi:MFS family permease